MYTIYVKLKIKEAKAPQTQDKSEWLERNAFNKRFYNALSTLEPKKQLRLFAQTYTLTYGTCWFINSNKLLLPYGNVGSIEGEEELFEFARRTGLKVDIMQSTADSQVVEILKTVKWEPLPGEAEYINPDDKELERVCILSF